MWINYTSWLLLSLFFAYICDGTVVCVEKMSLLWFPWNMQLFLLALEHTSGADKSRYNCMIINNIIGFATVLFDSCHCDLSEVNLWQRLCHADWRANAKAIHAGAGACHSFFVVTNWVGVPSRGENRYLMDHQALPCRNDTQPVSSEMNRHIIEHLYPW